MTEIINIICSLNQAEALMALMLFTLTVIGFNAVLTLFYVDCVDELPEDFLG